MTGARRPRLTVFRPISSGAARAIVVLFATSVLLSAAAGVIAVRAVQGEIKARATLTQLCQEGNGLRAQQVRLWEHIITISAPPPRQTPAQARARAALIASFQAYVRHVFASRDCSKLPAR